MKILAVQKEIPDILLERIMPLLNVEIQHLWELLQADILREIYRVQDTFLHVIVFECASVAEAQNAVDSLPLVREGLTAFELIPLAPYPGFARLFAES